MLTCLLLSLFVGASTARGQVSAAGDSDEPQKAADSTTGTTQPNYSSGLITNHESPSWLFPMTELDKRLPSWIRIGGQFRTRFEGQNGIGFTGIDDNYLLTRFRLRAIIEPNPWLSFHGELQDARIFFNHHINSGNPYEDSWTLWEAYPQIGNSTEGWFDVLAGRQVLAFGDERVIGPSNWTNVSRTFNVARVDVHHSDNKLSIFAGSVVPGDNNDLHNALPGNNLYGIYGSLHNVIPKGTLEPYVFWRVAPASPLLPEEVGHGHMSEVTVGVHAKGKLPASFDYDTEFDGQQGSLGKYSIGAWAGYVGLGKVFLKTPGTPRPFLELNYASGTKNPAGREWNTFDELYPSNHDKYGFADQVGRRNLVQYRVGVEEIPAKKWALKQQFEGFWLATANDNLYNGAGAIAVPAHPGASRHVGNEFDVVAEYTMNKGLNMGFGYGHFFVGPFLRETTKGHDFQYPYAYIEYNFTKSGFHFPISTNQPDYW